MQLSSQERRCDRKIFGSVLQAYCLEKGDKGDKGDRPAASNPGQAPNVPATSSLGVRGQGDDEAERGDGCLGVKRGWGVPVASSPPKASDDGGGGTTEMEKEGGLTTETALDRLLF